MRSGGANLGGVVRQARHPSDDDRRLEAAGDRWADIGVLRQGGSGAGDRLRGPDPTACQDWPTGGGAAFLAKASGR